MTVQLTALFVTLFIVGCTDLLGKNCTGIEVFGIHLTLIDTTVAGTVQVSDLVATARDGEFVDSFIVSGTVDFPIQLVPERPGIYSVEVTSTEYEPWQRSDIRVSQDEAGCHVEPVDVQVLLDRRP